MSGVQRTLRAALSRVKDDPGLHFGPDANDGETKCLNRHSSCTRRTKGQPDCGVKPPTSDYVVLMTSEEGSDMTERHFGCNHANTDTDQMQ